MVYAGGRMRLFSIFIAGLFMSSTLATSIVAETNAPEIGNKAPSFELSNQDGVPFSLSSREGKGWTVLYFYPMAETPGCTKQACAFRDAIEKIRVLGAEVYGISSDTVEDQAAFHANHKLKFDLLADPEAKVISAYAAKVPLLGIAKRWTFILDSSLVIRAIDKDVDPAMDPQNVVTQIKKLQEEGK